MFRLFNFCHYGSIKNALPIIHPTLVTLILSKKDCPKLKMLKLIKICAVLINLILFVRCDNTTSKYLTANFRDRNSRFLTFNTQSDIIKVLLTQKENLICITQKQFILD